MEKTNIINISSKETSSLIYNWTFEHIEAVGLSDRITHILTSVCLLIAAFTVLFIINYIVLSIFKSTFIRIIKRTKSKWDDYLLENKGLDCLSLLIMTILAQQMLPPIFIGFPSLMNGLGKFLDILVIFAVYKLINALLKTVRDILRNTKAFIDKPLDSYLQVIQIFLFFIIGTLIFSILTGNSPWSFLVSLGAASAILMLVFKDTILGFVASIQVSANDSVRVGDWIEMPKYGVDGDVLQINLNNVKVQNFDKTVVTIPTYTLLSDSFKNYRGMQDSGGRRIKRSINIKISSIRYLSNEEIAELKKIQLLAPYIDKRQEEIEEYNALNKADRSTLVNGRNMTNVGLFRAYIVAYAKHHPDIHKNMTLMVRQLSPTEHGLPLELYMFTNGTAWAFFEDTMSDIFDHLFAAIKYFDLEVFELPASDDLRDALKPILTEISKSLKSEQVK
ncbi:mechanosensitive ion channel family protein [Sphingobacterium wenxiniae]|uniref:Miniconductance mechanosensitive channel n=1 Tax=Sphingobacterium wenxiniae TaxID=683125 RepID=A0A1I6VEX0_9SPHI|nr:mechanosensitive ion channel domain-containing protein [Sphingobacterium wenxiniae]SFT12160.1 miniconductance mechanosensitive channel [Sphingobacterium wenxiniae]